MTAPSAAAETRPWAFHLVALAAALVMLGLGLGRFGIWQPSELRIADAARGNVTATASSSPTPTAAHDTPSRPPLQFVMVHLGFEHVGSTESGGRLPTALLAVLATMALALAVSSTSDARTGMFAGVAYVTMPLVFMNARQMFGGGVAQSTFTLLFAAGLYIFWGRPPPSPANSPANPLWAYGRWLLLATVFLAVAGAGWMLGVVPVLLGLGLAVVLRWKSEGAVERGVAALLALAGGVLGMMAIAAMVRPEHPAYSALTGFGPDAVASGPLPTYDALIEQIGHASFPWTGLLVFGMARLVMPPTMRWGTPPLGADAAPIDEAAAWRESGMRIGAALVAIVAFGLQEFSFQFFGPSPFVAAAPLAIACAITLRDAERDRLQWRIVTAGAVFVTIIVWRDLMLFPKAAYAALGLPDGGPTFPTGFTGNFGEWLHAHGGVGGMFYNVLFGEAPTEAYFCAYLAIVFLFALCPLFMGAGTIGLIAPSRPLDWLPEVERDARAELDLDHDYKPGGHRGPWWLFIAFAVGIVLLPGISWPFIVGYIIVLVRGGGRLDYEWQAYFSGDWALANLRVFVIGFSGLVTAIFGLASLSPSLNTVAKHVCQGFALAPIAIVLGIYLIIALWDFFAWLGQPRGLFARAFGSRLAIVPMVCFAVALIIAQRYVPALSEHLSPRGVWAVLRTVRQPNEPVARYGGQLGDRATRYYANFDVHDIQTEPDAVDWLRQTSPTHYLIVSSDVFPSLNRSYRRVLPEGPTRQNIPVIDATNSNLYVAASDAHARGTHNPLDAIVMSVDSDTGPNAHWHPHGVSEGGHTVPQAAVFDNAIEYLGYNLDSNNMSYVPAGGTFRIVYHFHVLREVPGNHQIFVHVDGQCPRINGDHEPAGGHYPLQYWLVGDYVHDEERITIPGYCRGGTYMVYLGFFQGDDRMRVEHGDHDHENRVVAARIIVR